MKSIQADINNSTDFLGFLSLGGVLLSGILLFTPVKAMGYLGMGGSVGTFTASVVVRKKHWQVVERELTKLTTQHKAELTLKDDELTIQTELIGELQGKLKQFGINASNQAKQVSDLQKQVEALQGQLTSLTRQNQGHRELIERCTGELEKGINLARTAVEEALEEWESRFTALLSRRKEQYPKLQERLSQLAESGQELLAEYAVKLAETPKKLDSLGDLLSLYYCLNDDCGNIRIKTIQAIATLRTQQREMELREIEVLLDEWESADLIPKGKVKEICQRYEAMLQEFRLDLSQRFESVQSFASSMESQVNQDEEFFLRLRMKVQELEEKVSNLSQPLKYVPATRADMKVANIVIEYFHRLGVILDRAGSDYQGWQATLEFLPDRTGRLVLPDELNEHSDKLQALTHTLNSPKFALDPESGLIHVTVQFSKKPKSDTFEQAKRLVSPLEDVVKKIIDGLSHKPTIRVMGATGDGKGVMARYLLNCILQNHPWYCRLHDPQDGSSEDHWGIPKVSRSGKELQQALKAISSQMSEREKVKNWEVVTLDVLDEIDTHLEKGEKKEAFIELCSRIRHCGMKLILIGQNPKVGRAGFEWSDMQQMNCIYMGASALDAIEANPQLKPRKDKLAKDYLALSEYYESANEGLDDGEKYLFGLVVIPSKTPLWVELPRPDSIKVECRATLLGRTFQVPNSLTEFVEDKNHAIASGNSGKTNRNLLPHADAESFVQQALPVIDGTADYVGVAGTDGTGGNLVKATCKKHSEAELRVQKDGRFYCPSCKKRLAKSDVEWR